MEPIAKILPNKILRSGECLHFGSKKKHSRMEGMYSTEAGKGLNLSDFNVSATPDDDTSVLLANTNKLLTAVGISAKRIESTEELSRVASSLFVAVYESLFHQKIPGVIRNPVSRSEFERNAQLVIDSLSDQIQLDLKHITGRSIVGGDLRVLSNLVHILVRIVSLTSQESLTSYATSEFERGEGDHRRYSGLLDGDQYDDHDDESLSTRSSAADFVSGDPYYMHGNTYQRKPQTNSLHAERMEEFTERNRLPTGFSADEDVKQALVKVDQRLQIEQKLHAARRRRDAHLRVREASSRAANTKQAQVSRAAAERRSAEDVEREERSFRLERSSAEQGLLRKIYKGLLKRVVSWKVDEQKEARAEAAHVREQTAWQLQSMQHLFEERLEMLRAQSADLRAASQPGATSGAKGELELARDLLQSLKDRNRALLERERTRLRHQRDKELLRRKEAHESLLAMLNVSDWQDMLRLPTAEVM